MKKTISAKISRVISLFLAIITIYGIFLFSPVTYAGTYGNFEYSISGGEVSITGFSGSGDVTIPSNINGYPVTKIGERAFFHCISLTGIVLPDSIQTIANYAFMSCPSLRSVTIGNGVTDIGLEAFMTCPQLKKLNLGKNLKRIEAASFSGCEMLEEVVFPDSLEIIGDASFSGCSSLKTVKLGKDVLEIGEHAFYGCRKLNRIIVDEENDSFVSIDDVLYTKDVTGLVWCPTSKEDIDIPGSVTVIGKGAFSGCGHIKGFEIPGNVTKIGSSAFIECDFLTNLIIPESVTEVERYAFAHISTLETVKIGSGIKRISDGLFEGCKSLTNLTVPKGVSEIGNKAFSECNSLRTVTIPQTVNSIGKDVFKKCLNLTDIYFGGTRDVWNDISSEANVPDKTTVHFGEAPPVEETIVGFIDVKADAFYADAVSWAVENEITSGTSQTTFSPNNGCTRGQVVTFLWRAAGEPEPRNSANPFSDVKEDDYYNKAVLWAAENDITKGTSETKFSPSDVCTRGQIVTFLWRAAGKPNPTKVVNPFGDVASDDYFYKSVIWAVEKGITKGTSDNSFSPFDTCTRGQVVTFMYRYDKNTGTQPETPTDSSVKPDSPITEVGLPATVEIYPYNDGNVAIVNVRNETGHDCTVKVRGTYKNKEGNEISSELKIFTGLSNGDDNYFIFVPGIAFENISCEIKEMKNVSTAYSDQFSFSSTGIASIPANNVDNIPDGYTEFLDKPLVGIDVYAPDNLFFKADILLFDNTGKPIFFEKYKGKTQNGHIDRGIPIECKKDGRYYILPDNLMGQLRVIVALVDISETMFE